jgi:hypothetical protein
VLIPYEPRGFWHGTGSRPLLLALIALQEDMQQYIAPTYKAIITSPTFISGAFSGVSSRGIKRHGRVVNIPALYSEDPGFKYRLGTNNSE